MAVLKRLQAADPGCDRSADPVRLLGDLQPGVLLGQAGGGDDQVREPVHPPGLLPVDVLGRVEVLHLAGEVDVEVARVELRDRPGSRAAGQQVLPRRLRIVAEGGHRTEAGDHDPAPPVEVCSVTHHIPRPPSTRSTSPVMNEASSEQRKRTAPATSSGSPKRWRGVFDSISSRMSSEIARVSRVSTYPGATTFARTPRGASSRASAFVKPMIPALDAE